MIASATHTCYSSKKKGWGIVMLGALPFFKLAFGCDIPLVSMP